MKVFVALLIVAVFAIQIQAANWVVLVAGSNGYGNYRHQSDVYDAYQILHMNGIPDDHIVVFHYDDIANSPSNPKKGQVFNWPGGPDVYKGVPKDYVGRAVSPANFLNCIQGVPTTGGSGKILKSTENDNVFIFFTDHGGPGMVAFPNGQVLHATQLRDAVNKMFEKKMYKKLVLYIEACESGSMCNHMIDASKHAYCFTASTPSQSSYACDYDNTVRAYLNDCWSINWMLDTRAHDTGGWTLAQQGQAVIQKTKQSQACQYGDMTFQNDEIAAFLGKKASHEENLERPPPMDAVPTHLVHLKTLERRMQMASGEDRSLLEAEYHRELYLKKRAQSVFRHMKTIFKEVPAPENAGCNAMDDVDMNCVQEAANAFFEECWEHDSYVLHEMNALPNFCRAGASAEHMRKVLSSACARLK
jgi:legumain